MIKIKSPSVALLSLLSILVFGQGNSQGYYQQSYENQISNNHLASSVSYKATNSETSLTTKPLSLKEEINTVIETMQYDPVLKNADWGFVVYDPKTKETIASYNEKTPLIPASTTKLLTTETAMNLLGPNFRWNTQLEYSGTIDENGNLNGNLYIIGSGDPSLGTRKAGAASYPSLVSDFIFALKDKGIKKINGDIITETAVFKNNKINSLPENIVWLERKNYFLPVGNTQNIDPKKEKLIVKQSSPTSQVSNYFYVSPYIHKLVYADEFSSSNLTTKLAEPPAYLANNLRATMVKNGIGISGKVISKKIDENPEPRNIVYTYQSPTLSEIIYATNQPSDNALAEATLRMVGFQKYGDQTLESGREAVKNHLTEAGFDMTGFNYMDGSGLSRSHTVTPISQAKFLASLMTKDYFKDYLSSLPIGGQSGTLKKMFEGTGNGSVFAKTGTLNKVKTLAGYIKTQSGKTLVFSLLVNNFSGSVSQVKTRMEELLTPVIND